MKQPSDRFTKEVISVLEQKRGRESARDGFDEYRDVGFEVAFCETAGLTIAGVNSVSNDISIMIDKRVLLEQAINTSIHFPEVFLNAKGFSFEVLPLCQGLRYDVPEQQSRGISIRPRIEK